MPFESLKTHNFRNLQDSKIELGSSKDVFLVGTNGQGKTNFLELIYYLCFGSSFRVKSDSLLLKQGEKGFYCGSRFKWGDNPPSTVDIKYQDKSKEIKLNGNVIRDRKDLIYQIPCIVFCHDDISFVNGQPERKRWFFDQTLSLMYPLYLDFHRKFKRILKERNAVLKKKRMDLLEIYTVQMVKEGLEIQKRRKELIESFNPLIQEIFRSISDLKGNFLLVYRPSWKNMEDEKEIFQYHKEKETLELEKGISLWGPHRDNYDFIYEGKNFLHLASTGQMRLLSLILRVVQAKLFASEENKRPVFLLDDVLLELDREKRAKFLNSLPDYEQAFYTFLPGDDTYHSKENSVHFSVEKGKIS